MEGGALRFLEWYALRISNASSGKLPGKATSPNGVATIYRVARPSEETMKPIIGRDYWPEPTLRQMPRGWRLAETEPTRWQWAMRVFVWLMRGSP